jgi:hypothetical protein
VDTSFISFYMSSSFLRGKLESFQRSPHAAPVLLLQHTFAFTISFTAVLTLALTSPLPSHRFAKSTANNLCIYLCSYFSLSSLSLRLPFTSAHLLRTSTLTSALAFAVGSASFASPLASALPCHLISKVLSSLLAILTSGRTYYNLAYLCPPLPTFAITSGLAACGT